MYVSRIILLHLAYTQELLKDPLGSLERLYDFIGLSLTTEDKSQAELELNVKHGPYNKSAQAIGHNRPTATLRIPSELFNTTECQHLLRLGHYEV